MTRSFGKYDQTVQNAVAKSFLADFPPEISDRVLADAMLVEFPANSIVYRDYDTSRMGVVLSGMIRLFLTSKEGRQITLRYYGPGEFIGLQVLVGGPIPVCVESVRETAALILDPAAIETLGKKIPGFGWRIAEEVGSDFCDLLVALGENAFDPVNVRVARHLAELAALVPAVDGTASITITQRELAEAVGSVREVISRTLRDFRRKGIIEFEPKSITILDTARLKTISRRE